MNVLSAVIQANPINLRRYGIGCLGPKWPKQIELFWCGEMHSFIGNDPVDEHGQVGASIMVVQNLNATAESNYGIEITREMIEAGKEVFNAWIERPDEVSNLIARVYRAIEEARRLSLSRGQQSR